MAKYYSETIFQQGKKIEVYDRKPEMLPYMPGQRLVMKLEIEDFRAIYPDVTKPETFEYFYQQYEVGNWLTYEVRLIDSAQL